MGLDSDPIVISGVQPDDLASIIVDIAGNIQYKLFGLMLVVYLIINSDVFTNRVLDNFKGAVNLKCPTSWGTVLQGVFLVLACVIIDAIIRQKII